MQRAGDFDLTRQNTNQLRESPAEGDLDVIGCTHRQAGEVDGRKMSATHGIVAARNFG